MKKNLFNVVLILFISIFLFACQKDLKETRLTTQVQDEAKLSQPSTPWQLASDLGVNFGSTVGPARDLFVPDGQAGVIYRIDPKTGGKTVFATGLPQMIPDVGIGGIMDVVFIGSTAYALVTLVDDPSLFPTGQVNGIYRIDGPNNFTVIADIGAFNITNPATGFPYDVSTGALYSIESYRGGFLVTDGHLNRVLQVSLDGDISVIRSFGDIVPTGLAIKGNLIYLSQAGPAPHLPEHGKVVSFSSKSSSITNVASGAPLLVDVEFGRGQTLFALSQGPGTGAPDGSPAQPNSGSLVRVNGDGTFSTIADEIDRPTSLEIIGNTAFITTLTGALWKIDNIARPPFGRSHH